MAEGVQCEVANLGAKYFCHQCSREVSPFSTELICPECSTGFLEEVSPDLFDSESIPDSIEYDSDLGEAELSFIHSPRFFAQMLDRVPEPEAEPEISQLEVSEDAPESESNVDSYLQLLHEAESTYANELFSVRYYDDFDNGDADIDDLASQLLDEVEISGPPPLSKEQIKSLPVVLLATEQEVKDLQCTVCMNDFKTGDKAKRLTCEHLFHEKCITPWLERQASCPNCRSSVKVESKDKRSLSCPRTLSLRSRPASSNNRRFSEVSSLGDFFTASMNPFRFL